MKSTYTHTYNHVFIAVLNHPNALTFVGFLIYLNYLYFLYILLFISSTSEF